MQPSVSTTEVRRELPVYGRALRSLLTDPQTYITLTYSPRLGVFISASIPVPARRGLTIPQAFAPRILTAGIGVELPTCIVAATRAGEIYLLVRRRFWHDLLYLLSAENGPSGGGSDVRAPGPALLSFSGAIGCMARRVSRRLQGRLNRFSQGRGRRARCCRQRVRAGSRRATNSVPYTYRRRPGLTFIVASFHARRWLHRNAAFIVRRCEVSSPRRSITAFEPTVRWLMGR